jgi:uncharacterized protein (DUF2235 family)
MVHPAAVDYETAAAALREAGLHDGDRLAVVGYAYNCYYARCARLRVAAQIPDTRQFCRLSAPEFQSISHRLAPVGVKALVAFNRPESCGLATWKDVKISDSTRLSILLLGL